jgi:hypothetical protein
MSDLVVLVESMDSEIVSVQQGSALEVFKDASFVEGLLDQIERAVMSQAVDDVLTAKGRKEIASVAHRVARTKTYLDGIGKELVAELKVLPALIDSNRKLIRDRLDGLKDKVRKPLTDWEDELKRIEQRKQDIAQAITDIQGRPSLLIGLSADQMSAVISGFTKPSPEGFDERYSEAIEAHNSSLAQCNELYEARKLLEAREREEYEKKVAEDARIKAEQEAQAAIKKAEDERLAAEAEAKARVEQAEARAKKAEEDRLAAEEKARNEKIEAEKRAENERIAAEQRAKKAAEEAAAQERARAEEQKRVEALEKARREADIAHRREVNNAVFNSILSLDIGLTEEQVKLLIVAVAKGKVDHVKIEY